MWKVIIGIVLIPFVAEIKSTIVKIIIGAIILLLFNSALKEIRERRKKEFIQDLKKELAETEKKDDQRD